MAHSDDAVEECYVYDFSSRAGIALREIVPNMQTYGPAKCFREKANDDFTGWTIWSSAVLGARWIIEHADQFKGKSVLELGSGCGLTGLAIALCTDAASVCLSDFPAKTLENLLHNVGLNCKRSSAGRDQCGGEGEAAAAAPLSCGDTFLSPRGSAVTVCRMDWDETATWPRSAVIDDAAAAAPPPIPAAGYATYDIIIGADLFYRRSYARKVASVAGALLRPGGTLICFTPTAREGLAALDAAMPGVGCVAEEEGMPREWRVNPLRRPGEGEVAGARLVDDEEATTMFPELFLSLYEIVAITYTRSADVDGGSATGGLDR